jgi:hypothetical protein
MYLDVAFCRSSPYKSPYSLRMSGTSDAILFGSATDGPPEPGHTAVNLDSLEVHLRLFFLAVFVTRTPKIPRIGFDRFIKVWRDKN